MRVGEERELEDRVRQTYQPEQHYLLLFVPVREESAWRPASQDYAVYVAPRRQQNFKSKHC